MRGSFSLPFAPRERKCSQRGRDGAGKLAVGERAVEHPVFLLAFAASADGEVGGAAVEAAVTDVAGAAVAAVGAADLPLFDMERCRHRNLSLGSANAEMPCPLQRSRASAPTARAACLLLIARQAHLPAIDEDALHLGFLIEDGFVADDEVGDFAVLDRAELAV